MIKLVKHILLLLFFCCNILAATSQTKETDALIIPCKNGTLFVDGTDKGTIEADDARKEKLSFGDHYIQLKTADRKYSITLRVDEKLTSNIIKIGCDEQPAAAAAIKLLDKKLLLYGPLNTQTEKNVIGLDQDDELIINCAVLNKKGSANISIKRYETGAEIYKKDGFYTVDNEHVRIPQKGIYIINLSTDALFGKEASLTLFRNPSKQSSPDFKTTVKVVADTTHEEVLTTTAHVYSIGAMGHNNRTVVKLNLPANTVYWAYWVGVGQESRKQMQALAAKLSAAGKFFTADPLVLFGMKLIPALPVVNGTSSVNYRFMNTMNAQLFTNGQHSESYSFKYADNIVSDYAVINGTSNDVSLCLWIMSNMIGIDVDIKVVAFSIKRKLVLEE